MGAWRRAARAWMGLSTRGKVGTAVVAVVVGAALASPGGTAPEAGQGVTAAPASGTATGAESETPADTTTRSPAAQPSPTRTTPSVTPIPTPSAPPPPTPSPSPTPTGPRSPRGDDALVLRTDRVVGVVDGDTVDLADGTRVRLAIVDTPEVHNGPEPCGTEASAFTRDLVLSEEVVVLRPSAAPVTDDFGRLLGEVVRTSDGVSLNVALAGAGLGTVDERFAHEDPDLASRARAAQSDAPSPACAPVAAPTPAPPPPASGSGHTGRTDGGWACHPAYRECLPASSDDLDCADVGHQVVLLGDDDPWRLDGNSTTRTDGVGCESYPPWDAGQRYPYE